jgi:putative ABC transport system permease protein
MSFWRIVLNCLKQHWFSACLASASIAAGISLLVAVYSLKEQSRATFTQSGLGVDAVLGPKGSPLQIALNSIYHLEDMPGRITWQDYQDIKQNRLVAQAIPFITGHSYGGFRVNAVDRDFLTQFEYQPQKKFSFAPANGGAGRAFDSGHEAVAGWAAARELSLKLGSSFNPSCGLGEHGMVHEHDHMKVVGIMAPTGTPHDRAIYIPLLSFYGLHGHPVETMLMAEKPQQRQISGVYLKLRRIRQGALHPGIQGLKYQINQSASKQLVIPNEVMPRLMGIIGWVDQVLMAIAFILTLISALFLFFSLLSSLREMKRDLALLRALGANRGVVMGLILSHGAVVSLAGGVAGLILGHGIVALGARFIYQETGVWFSAAYVSGLDFWVLPGVLLLAFLAALVPGLQAYRISVQRHLSA